MQSSRCNLQLYFCLGFCLALVFCHELATNLPERQAWLLDYVSGIFFTFRQNFGLDALLGRTGCGDRRAMIWGPEFLFSVTCGDKHHFLSTFGRGTVEDCTVRAHRVATPFIYCCSTVSLVNERDRRLPKFI